MEFLDLLAYAWVFRFCSGECFTWTISWFRPHSYLTGGVMRFTEKLLIQLYDFGNLDGSWGNWAFLWQQSIKSIKQSHLFRSLQAIHVNSHHFEADFTVQRRSADDASFHTYLSAGATSGAGQQPGWLDQQIDPSLQASRSFAALTLLRLLHPLPHPH